MAKTYKILMNDGSGVDAKPVSVIQGAAEKSAPTRLLAKDGMRIELQDDAKGKSLAPNQVRLKRMSKDLAIYFDNSQRPDVLIEDFYVASKEGGIAKVVGMAENGSTYEYVPQDPALSSMPSELKDENTPVIMSLGGPPMNAAFALSALPVAAVGGTGTGWLVAAGVGAAAAAGGGGGGGGSGPVGPAKATGALAMESDTGYSNKDGITSNTTPYYTGKVEGIKDIAITVDGHTYLGTSGPDGVYKIQITNPLSGNTYTPSIKVTDPSTKLSTTSDGESFTVDVSGSPDANDSASVLIGSISDDTGTPGDFITSDNSLSYSGRVSSFTSNGARVRLALKNSSGAIVKTEDVAFDTTTGAWSWNDAATTRADDVYTLTATLVDAAGNVITAAAPATQTIYISANGLHAVNDTGLAVEAGGTNNATAGTNATGNVLTNDTTISTALTKSAVPIAKTAGAYGWLTLAQDGSYTYEVDNANTAVDALRGTSGTRAAQTLTDTFQYTVIDLTGQTRTGTLDITVQGMNDVPTFSTFPGVTVLPTDMDASTFVPLRVIDKDEAESKFLLPSLLQGAYGEYQFNMTSQTWAYKVDTTKASVIAGNDAAEFHELITVTSFDGSGYQTLDVTIDGGGAGKPKVMNLINTTGVKAAGYSSLNDQIVLIGSGVTLDLTLATTRVSEVEKIDITGSGDNTIILNLNSVTQAHLDGGVHKLLIDGDSHDKVNYVDSIHPLTHSTDVQIGSTMYSRYVSGDNELLINMAITNVTV